MSDTREIRYEVREHRAVVLEVVGYVEGHQVSRAAITWREEDKDDEDREAHLDDVWVSSGWRRIGLGAHLIRKVKQVAKARGRRLLKGTFRAERWRSLFGLYAVKARGIIYGHAFAIPVDDLDYTLRSKYEDRARHLPFQVDSSGEIVRKG